jgi:hypothetical protein
MDGHIADRDRARAGMAKMLPDAKILEEISGIGLETGFLARVVVHENIFVLGFSS